MIAEIIKKRIKLDPHIRIKISILFQSLNYSVKCSLKLLRESKMVEAIIVEVYEADNAAGFQNAGYIFDDIKTFVSIIFENKSDPNKIEHA